MLITVIVCLIFLARLLFLRLSLKNEANILKNGGREYGQKNTQVLTLLHILFYLSCLAEAILRGQNFDWISTIGLVFLAFSIWMLYFVTRILKGIWTVKLMLVKDHKFIEHWLFRLVKHPNYYLNIIPELLGLTLLCHSYISFSLLFPCYLVLLYRRIRQEDELLRTIIIPNGIIQK